MQAIHSAITSAKFWATVKAVQEICFEAEFTGRFAEGCGCHQHVHDAEAVRCGSVVWAGWKLRWYYSMFFFNIM